MNNNLSISQLKALDNAVGESFAATLVIKKLSTKTASNGNPFLAIEFGDSTGSFFCTLFSDNPAYETARSLSEGSIVGIEGRVDYYQARLSPKLFKITSLNPDTLTPAELANLTPSSPEPIDQLKTELENFIESIAHDELRMTVRGVLEEVGDKFYTTAAAVSMHHAYRHGLIEHTIRMARAAKVLLPLYPEIDPSLAMAGILLHDTGKTIEYEGTLTTKRSRKGILQGHVVLGYQLARKHGIKAKLDPDYLERLEHIILSHQGEPAWGAAVYAATPEAVFVSMVDNLDAKMGMVQHTLRQNGNSTDDFSERLPGLNSPLLISPLNNGNSSQKTH